MKVYTYNRKSHICITVRVKMNQKVAWISLPYVLQKIFSEIQRVMELKLTKTALHKQAVQQLQLELNQHVDVRLQSTSCDVRVFQK